MTTKNEIYRILKNIDKETLYVEFKKSMILKNPNVIEKIAGEKVAFTNRYKGKLFHCKPSVEIDKNMKL